MEEIDLLWGDWSSARWWNIPGSWLALEERLKACVDLAPRAEWGHRVLASSKVVLLEKKKYTI